MDDPLKISLMVASSGLAAQSARLRVISENVANAQSTGTTAGANPYARKTITFDSMIDRASGASTVAIDKIGIDTTPFRLELDPGNPAADDKGYVKLPNVDLLVELADMREANRSYEANLQVAKQAADLFNQTVSLLREP